jgi:hypothetical protein
MITTVLTAFGTFGIDLSQLKQFTDRTDEQKIQYAKEMYENFFAVNHHLLSDEELIGKVQQALSIERKLRAIITANSIEEAKKLQSEFLSELGFKDR